MASDQALEPINVATSGIERVHFQRFCIRLLGSLLTDRQTSPLPEPCCVIALSEFAAWQTWEFAVKAGS